MTDFRREVELLIRAQLEGRGDIAKVTKDIEELTKVIDKQVDASKRGETGIDEFKASLLALQQVQDKLTRQAADIGRFQKLGEQLTATSARATKAAATYEEYAQKVNAAGVVTEKQQDRLIKLSVASERAQATFIKQTKTHAELAASLREAGISTEALAVSQDKIRVAAAQIGISINKTQQAIAGYAETVRAARAAEKALAEEAAFEKKLADAVKLSKAIDYVDFWTQALNEAETAEKKLAAQKALDMAADEALLAARNFQTLANASADLNPKITTLRDTVQGIINPAAQARRSLDGVETEIKQLATTIGAINGPVSNYREQLNALAAAQKSLSTQASLVDEFRQQLNAVKNARAEFVSARADVLRYAEEVRKGSSSTEQLAAAQARLAGASSAFQRQAESARAARAALEAAGISSSKLADAEARIAANARTATSAVNTLTGAFNKYGGAVQDTTGKLNIFTSGGRTTLGLMQRIKGEVLALTASFVGLQGILSLASGSAGIASQIEGIKNQLALSVGNDPRAIGETFEYIRGQAERLGLEFIPLAKSFAKFSASATQAGRSQKEIRGIFEAFSEVGKVANLTTDQMNGVFTALDQIVSKGKIQAEELRGQLGERLFGAFQIAAKALSDQFPNLDKALEQGQVSASQLLLIAQKYRETVADQLGPATENFASQQNRFNTAVSLFKATIADSGWLAKFADLLVKMTAKLESAEGQKFAQSISDAFSLVADTIIFVIDNLDTLTRLAKTAFQIFVAFKTVGAVTALVDFAKAARGATGAVGLLTKAFLVLSVAWAAWNVLDVIVQKMGGWQKLMIMVTLGFQASLVKLKGAFTETFASLDDIVREFFLNSINNVKQWGKDLLGTLAKAAAAAGKSDLAASLQKTADSITKSKVAVDAAFNRVSRANEAEIAALAAKARAELKKIDAATKAVGGTGTKAGAQTQIDTSELLAENARNRGKGDEAALKKRAATVAELLNQVQDLEARVDRAKTNTLEVQKSAIDQQTADLEARLQKLGGQDGAALLARFRQARTELKANLERDFNDKILESQMSLQEKLDTLAAAASNKERTNLVERQKAIVRSYADTYRQIAELRETLLLNKMSTQFADEAKVELDAGVKRLQELEEFKTREAQLNQLLETREAILARIESERRASRLSDADAETQTLAAITAAQPAIDALANSSVIFAESMRAALGPEAQAFIEAYIAKVRAAQATGAELDKTVKLTRDNVEKMFAGRAANAISAVADSFGEVIDGTKSFGDAIKGLGQIFAQFAADFLKDIALMIIKLLIFNALKNSTNPILKGIGTAGANSVSIQHSGGLVGGVSNRTRAVPGEWFANAPRYHDGGMVGLAPNEVPAILEKTEEVLSKDDPRNILNGGGRSTGGAEAPTPLRIINTFNAAEVVSEGLGAPENERVIMNIVRKNRQAMNQLLGRKG